MVSKINLSTTISIDGWEPFATFILIFEGTVVYWKSFSYIHIKECKKVALFRWLQNRVGNTRMHPQRPNNIRPLNRNREKKLVPGTHYLIHMTSILPPPEPRTKVNMYVYRPIHHIHNWQTHTAWERQRESRVFMKANISNYKRSWYWKPGIIVIIVFSGINS